MLHWRRSMQKRPSWVNKATRGVQKKWNKIIPEKVHEAITKAIREMIRGMQYGAGKIAIKMDSGSTLHQREMRALKKIKRYQQVGAVEGGLTGAGGFLWAMADLPLLLSVKMKLLYDLAAIYGFDTRDYRERLFLLHIFQLAFAGQQHRNKIFDIVDDWDYYSCQFPENMEDFDWRSFQQEYRDYIDLAKMAQMVPVIGAAVGLIANYKLLEKLGETAIQSYRMRIFEKNQALSPA